MASANAGLYKNRSFMGRRKRRIIDAGAIYSVNHDGMVVARARRRGFNFPFKGLAIVAIALIGFKVLVLTSIGETQYGERQALLAEGSSAEKVGAYVMQVDPVTAFVQSQLNNFLR